MAIKCITCGQLLPRDSFYPYKRSANGLTSDCRTCRIRRSNQRYANNRAEILANLQLLKEIATRIYGSECAVCFSQDNLEFDHKNTDGHNHRRQESRGAYIRRIVKTGKTLEDVELQLLCKPCHKLKTSPELSAMKKEQSKRQKRQANGRFAPGKLRPAA